MIVFANHWLNKAWSHEIATDCLEISRTTSVDWQSFCSEVTEHWLSNQDSIGSPGVTVKIDETLIAKRKYNRGRVLAQVWLFGGIERVSKKSFIVPLVGPLGEAGRRDRGTLLPLIQQYIRPGSVVISDQWGAYNKLSDFGYTHHTINHSENFVDPTRSYVHTQNIERLWRDVKEWVKRPGIKTRFLHQYLSRYLFMKAHMKAERLHAIFTYAAKLYPPQSDQHHQLQPLPLDEDIDDEH